MDPKLGAIPALLNAAQILWQAHMLLGFPPDDILEEKAKELTSLALSDMQCLSAPRAKKVDAR